VRRSRSMPATIRLLGPDLGNSPLLVEVEPTDTIEILKKHTLEKWPAGLDIPQAAQLRIIFQGRFMADHQGLKECKVVEGETTAMHLIIKSVTAKPESSAAAADDKAPKCSCVIC